MAGAIHENQTFSGTVSDCDGDVFINCTFQQGTTVTGDGMTFIGCSFQGNCNPQTYRPVYITGTGSTVSGGSSVCTIFGPVTVVGDEHSVGSGVTFGPDSNVHGAMFTFSKPVVDTNLPCKQETEGETPAEVREVCWNMRREDETQSTEGSRA